MPKGRKKKGAFAGGAKKQAQPAFQPSANPLYNQLAMAAMSRPGAFVPSSMFQRQGVDFATYGFGPEMILAAPEPLNIPRNRLNQPLMRNPNVTLPRGAFKPFPTRRKKGDGPRGQTGQGDFNPNLGLLYNEPGGR